MCLEDKFTVSVARRRWLSSLRSHHSGSHTRLNRSSTPCLIERSKCSVPTPIDYVPVSHIGYPSPTSVPSIEEARSMTTASIATPRWIGYQLPPPNPTPLPEIVAALKRVATPPGHGGERIRVAGDARHRTFHTGRGPRSSAKAIPPTKMTIMLKGEIHVRREQGAPRLRSSAAPARSPASCHSRA